MYVCRPTKTFVFVVSDGGVWLVVVAVVGLVVKVVMVLAVVAMF